MSLAQHIVFRLEDSRHIFLDVDVRRLFSRTVARIGEDFDLVIWGAGDDHAHSTVMGEEAPALEFARRVEISMTRSLRLGVGFRRASSTTVRDQSHLRATIPYDLDQPRRHGVDDPFHEGTSLPDLLDARVLAPYLAERIARHLPNLRLDRFTPPSGTIYGPHQGAEWTDAVKAAIGRTSLRGKDALALDARRAVLHFASEAPRRELLDALQISPRALARLQHRPLPNADLLAAIETQARWRNAPLATGTAADLAALVDPRPARRASHGRAPMLRT